MGNYKTGILGSFHGKVGTVVGSSWKGIDYIKSLPRKSGKAPTEAQKAQNLRFALAIAFNKPISELINVGFASFAKQKLTGYNIGVRYTIKNAITGSYPNFALDYSKIIISEGQLSPLMNGVALSTVSGLVTITWVDNTLTEAKAFTDDRLIYLIYHPERNRAIYNLAGVDRNAEVMEVLVPDNFSGEYVEVYAAFISRDGKAISNSEYLGNVLVAL